MTLIATALIAFILIVIALAALGIGWLITGKSRIVAGACGRAPSQKRDESCGTNTVCTLCHKPNENTEEHKL